MTKRPLLLLHGALGSSAQLAPLSMFLHDSFVLGLLDFSSHGKKSPIQTDLSFDVFVNDILQWLKMHKFEKIDIFGYSMGGYAALVMAQKYPEKVNKIFTLGAKLLWTKEEAEKESQFLHPEKIETKTPEFADRLKDFHGVAHWSGLVNNTREFILSMGNKPPLDENSFKDISSSVLLGIGDKDTMAKVEDTVKVYGWLPRGELLVIPNTPHPFEEVDVESMAQQILRFFK